MSEQNSEPRPFDPPVPPTAPPAPPTQPPAAPPAPPVAPPAPDRPSVPQYGEYAPAGYVSPVAPTPPAAPANPYGVPGYAAPATPSNMYGVPTAGAPAAGAAPAYAPIASPRTGDRVFTIILLVLGLFGMGIGLLYAAVLPTVVQSVLDQRSLGKFSGSTTSASVTIVISHLVLYVLAVGISIPRLLRRRITFWVPLAAGVVAFFIFWGLIIGTILGDPAAAPLLNP